MKANKKQVNRIFKDMSVDNIKEWHTTTSKVVHKDKKKQKNKHFCRKEVLCYG